jgi:hypothetical protein
LNTRRELQVAVPGGNPKPILNRPMPVLQEIPKIQDNLLRRKPKPFPVPKIGAFWRRMTRIPPQLRKVDSYLFRKERSFLSPEILFSLILIRGRFEYPDFLHGDRKIHPALLVAFFVIAATGVFCQKWDGSIWTFFLDSYSSSAFIVFIIVRQSPIVVDMHVS